MNALETKVIENEIMKALTTLGPQPSCVFSYAYGPKASAAIRNLHAEGKIEKWKSGWKAK